MVQCALYPTNSHTARVVRLVRPSSGELCGLFIVSRVGGGAFGIRPALTGVGTCESVMYIMSVPSWQLHGA